MGIFSKLFSQSLEFERQLEKEYILMLQQIGMSSSQAVSTVHEMLDQAKKESRQEKMSDLPQKFGIFLLENEVTNDKIKKMLAKRRKEGVKDEDIRWWWNMHDLERRMMLKFDDISRLSLYKSLREEDGFNENEAAKEVKKWFPIYGDPDDTTHDIGDDRPLPEELKNRINIYIEKMYAIDPEKYKQKIINYSSFNALVRYEIRDGKL